jgi:hypothetical protein
MPHARQFVFQTTMGGFVGQPGGCERTDQRAVVRPLVCEMKLVQIRLFKDLGR